MSIEEIPQEKSIGFPHAMNGCKPAPIMVRECFAIDGFPIVMQIPSAMTMADLEDFEEWLALVSRKLRRWSEAYNKLQL